MKLTRKFLKQAHNRFHNIYLGCKRKTSHPEHFTSHVDENGPGLDRSHDTLNFEVFSMIILGNLIYIIVMEFQDLLIT